MRGSSSTRSAQVLPQAPGLWKVPSGFRRNQSGWSASSAGAPARVVHDDVEDQLARRVGGRPEVSSPNCCSAVVRAVEVQQGRVDGREVQLGVRASEPAHAGVGGGHGADGQQVQDAAAQAVEDVGQRRP